MIARNVRLGDVLSKSQNWIVPSPDDTYKQITARLWGKGLTLRGEVSGSQIAATRQLQAKAGQFLISRIDARHGAFGIVPPSLDGALVSNDFPCFDIDVEIALPDYIGWYARTERFIGLCHRASVGSTNRVRLQETKFLEMEICVPPADEQKKIVGGLNKMAILSEKHRKTIEAVEYDIQAILSNAFHKILESVPYRPMSEVAPLVRRPVEVNPDRSYPELGVRSFGRGTFHKPALSGIEVGSKKLFRIQKDDLVFNIVFAWEGAIAVARAEDESSRWFTPLSYVRTVSCAGDEQLSSLLLPKFGGSQKTRKSISRRSWQKPDTWIEETGRDRSTSAKHGAPALV